MDKIEAAIAFLESIKPACPKCLYNQIVGECNPDCKNPHRAVLIDVAIGVMKESTCLLAERDAAIEVVSKVAKSTTWSPERTIAATFMDDYLCGCIRKQVQNGQD